MTQNPPKTGQRASKSIHSLSRPNANWKSSLRKPIRKFSMVAPPSPVTGIWPYSPPLPTSDQATPLHCQREQNSIPGSFLLAGLKHVLQWFVLKNWDFDSLVSNAAPSSSAACSRRRVVSPAGGRPRRHPAAEGRARARRAAAGKARQSAPRTSLQGCVCRSPRGT